MNDFLGNIYCWFESLFGLNLAEYLWGYNCDTLSYGRNIFNQVGLITIFVSLFFVILYYYIINHPRLNRWWYWMIFLGVSTITNLFIGYAWTVSDFLNGIIPDCLMYTRDEEGNVISQLIHASDCWMFGLANAIIAAMWFVIFTFIFKWWSRNCKYSPI